MSNTPSPASLAPALSAALEGRGYTQLTPVQQAVLDPAVAGRDLRITSQTGSGKTVAIGLVLYDAVARTATSPRAIVLAPTRELAKQVEEELSWLYAALRARVASVTGGASYRDEHRALAAGPAVVVGTPGRLLDHLRRGGIDTSAVGAVVFDEADRLLDMGFREDIEAILGFMPETRRTHLVSATFPSEVRALADRAQADPVHVEGTRLGAANADIDHVVHVVDGRQRLDAMVNLLLANPDEQTLIFGRTRADVAAIGAELSDCGFGVTVLSGELDQRARTRALTAFRKGDTRVLVATDVAARGIDVQDIARVIHAESPSDPDSYTHRSGRTGRAGRKGTSAILATVREVPKLTHLLRRAGVTFRLEALPTADVIRAAAEERLIAELLSDSTDGPSPPSGDAHLAALAQRILESPHAARAVARLLARLKVAGPTAPRELRAVELPAPRAPQRDARPPRPDARAVGPAEPVAFRVSWGQQHGADARRLLAMACRRGGIQGSDVGSIRVARTFSVIEIAGAVADAFERAASEPDPRDPRIRFRREHAAPPAPAARPARRERPSHRAVEPRGEGGGGARPLRRPRPAR